MTDREKAIVMAYTGATMLEGDKFSIFHKYIEDICGRPIYTHEIAFVAKEIKEKSRADFIELCREETRACDWQEPKTGRWIPVSERLPEKEGYYITQTMYQEVYCDYWEGERFERTETVIAWMPLPEPYKESEG